MYAKKYYNEIHCTTDKHIGKNSKGKKELKTKTKAKK
jgi:hypothetical protein